MVVWSLANSHDTAVHLPTVKVFFVMLRGSVGSLSAMASDSVSAPSSQVVFRVVSEQRKLYSVGAIGGATACTMRRSCTSHECSCHEPVGCDAMCSLSAMQAGHGHSKCSHLEGAARIMTTEGGQKAIGESELRESLVLEGRGSRWASGRTCRRAESSYRSTRNHST